MNWMILTLISASLSVVLLSCGPKSSTETPIASHQDGNQTIEVDQDVTIKTHFNINIVADLTNRVDETLYPKPLHDTIIINTVIDLFYPTIVKHRRRMHQRDLMRFRLVNSIHGASAESKEISLEQFSRQADRIEYINKSLGRDLKDFKTAIHSVYTEPFPSEPSGDMYQLFQKTIKPAITRNSPRERVANGNKTIDAHRNILILLTDGYVEYGVYGRDKCKNNQCPFLTPQALDAIRQKHKSSGLSIRETIEKFKMGLVPFNAPLMAEYEVLVLECYDRSLSIAGSARKIPTDFDIMKEVWSVWLKDSGVKRSEIHSTANTRKEVEDILKGFLFNP